MKKTTHRVWIFYDNRKNQESKPLTLTQAQIFILNLRMKDFDQFLIWTPGWVQWMPLGDFLDSEQNVFTSMKIPRPKVLNVKPAKKLIIDDLDTINKASTKKTKRRSAPKNPMNSATAEMESENTSTSSVSIITMTEHTNPFPQTESYLITNVDENKPKPAQDYGYYFNDFSIHDVKRMVRKGKSEKSLEDLDRRRHLRGNMRIEVILVSATGVSFRSHSKDVSLGGTLLEDKVPPEYAKHPFDIIFINKFETDQRQSRLLIRGKVVGDVTHPERLVFISPNPETLMRLEKFIHAYAEHAKKNTKAVS